MKKNSPITEETKDFEAVKFMRMRRDQIGKDISQLSKEDIIEYFKKNVPTQRVKPSV